MRNKSSSKTTSGEAEDEDRTRISLPIPVGDPELFKHGATPHVLNFLSDNPEINVSIRQLAKVTPLSERATREAVDALEGNELVETFHEGNARRVQINRQRLDRPEDPVQKVPQLTFRTPVRTATRKIRDELRDVKGVVLFGSVARGEGDRQSDIDLWVLLGGDHMQQRHEANDLAARLGELSIPQTFPVAEATADPDSMADEIEDALVTENRGMWSAERYSFEIVVETPQSIIAQSDRVDAEKLFGEGITLFSTETLERVKEEVLRDE